jgi:hypothetical protein
VPFNNATCHRYAAASLPAAVRHAGAVGAHRNTTGTAADALVELTPTGGEGVFCETVVEGEGSSGGVGGGGGGGGGGELEGGGDASSALGRAGVVCPAVRAQAALDAAVAAGRALLGGADYLPIVYPVHKLNPVDHP